MMLKVSILLLLYKPDVERTILTLQSILEQRNIEYEVIVADDGSKYNLFGEIKEYVEKNGDLNAFTFISHDKNYGTVKNYYDALKVSRGEYVYAISPGDILYDPMVIDDFYNYCKKDNIKLCFGDACRYSIIENNIVIRKDVNNNPPKTVIFDSGSKLLDQKTGLFFGNLILGATFFRERNTTITYFERIIGRVRYVEDTSTSFLFSLDGNRIFHFKRKMVWYEHGVGVSAKGNHLTDTDIDNIYDIIKTQYKKDPIVDAAVFDHFSVSKKRSLLYRLVRHPILYFRIEKIKRFPTTQIKVGEADELSLNIRFDITRRRLACK